MKAIKYFGTKELELHSKKFQPEKCRQNQKPLSLALNASSGKTS